MFSYYLQAVWGMHDLTFILCEDKLDATFLSIHIYGADNRYLICFGGICKCTTIFRVRSNSDYDSGHLLVFLMYVHMKGPYNLFWLGGGTPVHLELAGRVHFTLHAPTLDSPISSYFVDDAG